MLNSLNWAAIKAFIFTSYKKQLAYRIANWSGLFTNVFFLFIRAGVFIACYQEKEVVAGLTIIDTLTYLTLTQSFFTLMPHLGNMGLSEHVMSGQIAVEINRPMNFYVMFMAKRTGIFFYYVMYRFFPILLVGMITGILRAPSYVEMLPFFALSVFLGFWIAVSIMFIVEATSFWFQTDRGVKVLMYGVFAFFSGLLIPLNYFPEWAMNITRFVPFAYTFHIPVQFYLGLENYPVLLNGLFIQFLWAVAITIFCLFVFKRGESKVVVHGG
jgi:ABC-2 type transport system permease protein